MTELGRLISALCSDLQEESTVRKTIYFLIFLIVITISFFSCSIDYNQRVETDSQVEISICSNSVEEISGNNFETCSRASSMKFTESITDSQSTLNKTSSSKSSIDTADYSNENDIFFTENLIIDNVKNKKVQTDTTESSSEISNEKSDEIITKSIIELPFVPAK